MNCLLVECEKLEHNVLVGASLSLINRFEVILYRFKFPLMF